VAALLPGSASAAAADEDEPTVMLRHTAAVASMDARFGRASEWVLNTEMDWLRLSLEDDLPFRLMSVRPFSDGIDIRDDLWAATPRALTSVATAATSLVTSGISVFEVWRGGKLRMRHGMRMYWRSRGVKLAWRIEF
jgi:hypothetical protein